MISIIVISYILLITTLRATDTFLLIKVAILSIFTKQKQTKAKQY